MYLPDEQRYGKMTHRRCGASGLWLPAISLGLWHNFGGADALENMRAMLCCAFELGITHFNLANSYGPPPVLGRGGLRPGFARGSGRRGAFLCVVSLGWLLPVGVPDGPPFFNSTVAWGGSRPGASAGGTFLFSAGWGAG